VRDSRRSVRSFAPARASVVGTRACAGCSAVGRKRRIRGHQAQWAPCDCRQVWPPGEPAAKARRSVR